MSETGQENNIIAALEQKENNFIYNNRKSIIIRSFAFDHLKMQIV